MKTKDNTLSINLARVASKNMGRVFFSLFAIGILEAVNSFVFAGASSILLTKFSETPYIAAGYALIACGLFVWFMISCGFYVMLLRMSRGEYVTIGYLFYGFRRFKTYAPVSFFYTVVISFLSLFIRILHHFILGEGTKALAFVQKHLGENGDFFIVLGFSAVILLITLYVLIFTVNFRYDNPEKSVLWCAKLSHSVVHPYFFKFIWFVLRSAGRNLILAFFYGGFTLYTSGENQSFLIQIFSLIFNFLYFVNMYKAFSIACLCVPVFYQWAIDPKIDIIVDFLKEAVEKAGGQFVAGEEGMEAIFEANKEEGDTASVQEKSAETAGDETKGPAPAPEVSPNASETDEKSSDIPEDK